MRRAVLTEQALKKRGTEPSTQPTTRSRQHHIEEGRMQASTQGSRGLEVLMAIFVDRTTDGLLVKKMREAEGRLSTLTKYKFKVVEKNGITLSQSLVQRDPFK